MHWYFTWPLSSRAFYHELAVHELWDFAEPHSHAGPDLNMGQRFLSQVSRFGPRFEGVDAQGGWKPANRIHLKNPP